MRRRAAAMDGGGEWDEERRSTAAHHREVMAALAANQNSLTLYVHLRLKNDAANHAFDYIISRRINAGLHKNTQT